VKGVQGRGLGQGGYGATLHGGKWGAIIRVHDLYRDPALTSCSQHQSEEAGPNFLQWLVDNQETLHFIGSSFLMRAYQTARAMFVTPCERNVLNCSGVMAPGVGLVTPIPFITEGAPEGLAALEADNTARDPKEQLRILRIAGHVDMDSTYSGNVEYPRGQHWEKFKVFLAKVLVPKLLGGTPVSESSLLTEMDSWGDTMHQSEHTIIPDKYGRYPNYHLPNNKYKTAERPFDRLAYDKFNAATTLNIAVVGHNQMMSEYCLKNGPIKPNNNAVLEKLFYIEYPENTSSTTVIHEMRDNCPKVMGAPSKTDSMEALVEGDVSNCVDVHFGQKFKVNDFIRRGPDPNGMPSDNTACVNFARARNAYPVLTGLRIEEDSMNALADYTRVQAVSKNPDSNTGNAGGKSRLGLVKRARRALRRRSRDSSPSAFVAVRLPFPSSFFCRSFLRVVLAVVAFLFLVSFLARRRARRCSRVLMSSQSHQEDYGSRSSSIPCVKIRPGKVMPRRVPWLAPVAQFALCGTICMYIFYWI